MNERIRAVFGTHDANTLAQLEDVASRAEMASLMADGHLGYEVRIVDATLALLSPAIERAAREIASLCADHASDLYVPGTDHLAAIIRREMGVGER